MTYWHVIFWTNDRYTISCLRTHVPVVEVWEQKQIRRVLELGIRRGKKEIVLLESGRGTEFKELMNKVREEMGLAAPKTGRPA